MHDDPRVQGQAAIEALFREACERVQARTSWKVITDYAPADLAESRVKDAIEAEHDRRESDFRINCTSVRNFNTRQAGFYALVKMLAPSRRLPKSCVGYVNVAPIPDSATERNGGQEFLAVLLTNGRIVFSPNAEYSFSYLAPYIVAIAEIDAHDSGKQFRSWDCFPPAAMRFLSGDFGDVKRFAAEWEFPVVQGYHVAGIDNFFNLETDYSDKGAEQDGFQLGDAIEFSIDGGETWHSAVYGTRRGKNGELFSLDKSSKIIETGHGETIQFHDIFVLGGQAATELGLKAPGVSFHVRHRQEEHIAEQNGAHSAVRTAQA